MILNKNLNVKKITEAMQPSIKKILGDKAKKLTPAMLESIAVVAHNQLQHINEAHAGFSGPYNTANIGNPTLPGGIMFGNGGADFSAPGFAGSPDMVKTVLPIAVKAAFDVFGMELVHTIPVDSPRSAMPFMDFFYGSKQTFGGNPIDTVDPNPYYGPNGAAEIFGRYVNPYLFKASVVLPLDEHGKPTVKRFAFNSALMKYLEANPTAKFILDEKYDVEIVSLGRLDGDPIIRVKGVTEAAKAAGTTVPNIASLFHGAAINKTPLKIVAGEEFPELPFELNVYYKSEVSTREDYILGVSGSGRYDNEGFIGHFDDGTKLYSPMDRATGEAQEARQIQMLMDVKEFTVGTIQLATSVSIDQVNDYKKQWDIDVLKTLTDEIITVITQDVSHHILNVVSALGWKTNVEMYDTTGEILNISYDSAIDETVAYASPEGEIREDGTYPNYTNISLPVKPVKVFDGASFENQPTMLTRIQHQIAKASNLMEFRGRHGGVEWAIVSANMATALQILSTNSFTPFKNTITQDAGKLYQIGTLNGGVKVYVNKFWKQDDPRITVGRKGVISNDGVESGLIFCPYLMLDKYEVDSEGTFMPKVLIRSRYALVEAGYFPHYNYITFTVEGLDKII